jgi:predicted peroxiredoxin
VQVRRLNILVAGDDGDRLHAALSFAAAGAASGNVVRVHLHEGAVGLLRAPIRAPADADRARSGIPMLAELLDEVLALGVTISVCQSGLALYGIDLETLDPRIEAQGPVGFLAMAGDDRPMVF